MDKNRLHFYIKLWQDLTASVLIPFGGLITKGTSRTFKREEPNQLFY